MSGAAGARRPAPEPAGEKQALRLWLRLVGLTARVEKPLRERLKARFGTTLPRFDALAALDRAREGLTMGELSRRLMVSNGNTTGIIDRLVAEGWVERLPTSQDRRTVCVRITDAGRREFADMARAHELWVAEIFAALTPEEITACIQQLTRLRAAVESLPEDLVP